LDPGAAAGNEDGFLSWISATSYPVNSIN